MHDLEVAHARIQELEDRIAGLPPPGPSRRRRALLAAAYLLALGGIAVAMAIAVFPRRTRVLVAAPSPAPPGILAGALRWRAGEVFRDHGPLLVDVNHDGVEDVVGLAWRHEQDEAALHVVAFDRTSYAVVWRSGPFPARWRDDVVRVATFDESSLVVVDGLGAPHVLDRATGVETAVLPASLAPRVETRGSCLSDRTLPCTETSTDETTARATRALREPGSTYDLVDGNERVTIGSVSGPEAQHENHVLRWDTASKKLLFNVPLIPRGPENSVSFSPNEWTALGRGRIVHLYESAAREYRLATRDSTTGRLAYDVVVPALHDGSMIGAMTTDRDEVFVVADESLIVLDASTGAVAHRLARF